MKLLSFSETDIRVINKTGETALDIAERAGNSEVATILKEHGVQSAETIRPTHPAHELKQTVSDIKHGVQSQLQHTHQTSRHVLGIAKRLKKLHREGLNNAINSTTVVAVLIATVAVAAIFIVPGQYAVSMSPGISIGEANIAHQTAFMIFFIFDSVALFISLAVVVVQTSLVVIESKAKKTMMTIINKLMWLACVFMAVAFLALSFIAVGRSEIWLAVSVTVLGTVILAATLFILTYWVVVNRIEAKKIRSNRKSSLSRLGSHSLLRFSDTDLLYAEKKQLYAI
ncbi:Ankyrin repeat-containing protein [Platanthera guangdongensis]|uniref:Ankyrin repeat-containing protein n=1 Tax=Platanthera guangdongensis TaxID=2320717 RepID=A0ABR2MIR4_9ASPA